MNRTIWYGMGLMGPATLALFVLKLCHVINWHWVWIPSPIWVPFAAVTLFFLLYMAVAAMIAGGDKIRRSRHRKKDPEPQVAEQEQASSEA